MENLSKNLWEGREKTKPFRENFGKDKTVRFLYCLYPFFYWLKTGAYGCRKKTLYETIRAILLTIKWMFLGMTIQKIIDGIYIGDIESQMRIEVRKENRIGALLNCAFEIKPKLRENELPPGQHEMIVIG